MNALFPTDLHSRGSPLFYLVTGFIVFCVGVQSILAGRTWVRFNGWVYAADEPKSFWCNVLVLFLIALFLIGYCLYLVNAT
jgi:hypothetical protein